MLMLIIMVLMMSECLVV